MASGYKKYMKKNTQKNNTLVKIFVVSFFGMLLLCTFAINYLSKNLTVDTSIGDYKEQKIDELEDKKIIDVNRLEMIQNEDQGKNFSDIMDSQEKQNSTEQVNDTVYEFPASEQNKTALKEVNNAPEPAPVEQKETTYKVFIGTYTSAEQAKVAKEIIQESGNGLTPIVKNLNTNNYTLQVGSFKNKQSAQSLLNTVQQNHLPGRIVEE